VIADLHRTGTLREGDQILSLKTVHGSLDDLKIAYCGRYGDWGYMWTAESYISGVRAAEAALSSCRALA